MMVLHIFASNMHILYARDKEISAHIPCCVEDYNFQMQPNIAQSAPSVRASPIHHEMLISEIGMNNTRSGYTTSPICVYIKCREGGLYQTHVLSNCILCAPDNIVFSLSFLEEIRGKDETTR